MSRTDASFRAVRRQAPRPGVRRSWWTLGALLLAGLSPATRAVPPPDGGSVEHRVKAAFLYKFAKFVEWPGSPDALSFCVIGSADFEETLDRTVAGKSIQGLPVRVSRIPGAADTADCSVVFVSDADARTTHELLEAVADRSVLTVGDDARFTRSGGIVNFIVTDGRVVFEINVQAAERAGLRLSSKLLSLARIVETTTAEGR